LVPDAGDGAALAPVDGGWDGLLIDLEQDL